jgi:diguanylate cyclase (GGDEF)-like protein
MPQLTSHTISTIDTLNDQAWAKRDANPREARALSEEAKRLAESSQYELGVGRSLTVSSFLHYRAGRFAEGLQEGLFALEILEAKHDAQWLCKLYNNLGIIYDGLGDRPQAMSWLLKQLELAQQQGDKQQEATALHDLGFLTHDPEQGRSYFQQALEMFREVGDNWGVALANINLAEGYLTQGSYQEALRHAHDAIAVEEHDGEAVEKAFTVHTLGNIYAAQKKYSEALEHYHQAVNFIREGMGDGSLEPSVLLSLGNTYQTVGETEKALSYLNEALQLAQRMDFRVLIYQAHQALASYYKANASFEQALYHFEQFHSLKEKIFNSESEQKMRAMEVLHRTETARKEAELQQRKNKELQEHIHSLEELNAQVRALSVSDPLTGLYNRRYLFEYLSRLEPAHTISIAILDLDHFKRINDTYSHFVGDDVLRGTASLLTASLRGTDIAARFGGEEFVIVFHHTTLEQAVMACERLRQAVELNVWSEIHPRLRATISVGLVSGLAKDYETLLLQADQKLYEAKARRNTLVY